MTSTQEHAGNFSDFGQGYESVSRTTDTRAYASHDPSVYPAHPSPSYPPRTTIYSQQGYSPLSQDTMPLPHDSHPVPTYYQSGISYPFSPLSSSTSFSSAAQSFQQGASEHHQGTSARRMEPNQGEVIEQAYHGATVSGSTCPYAVPVGSRPDASPPFSPQAPSRLSNLHSSLDSPPSSLVPSQALPPTVGSYMDQHAPSLNPVSRSNHAFFPPTLSHPPRGVAYLSPMSPPAMYPQSPSPYTTPLASPHPSLGDAHQLAATTALDQLAPQSHSHLSQSPFIAAVLSAQSNPLELAHPSAPGTVSAGTNGDSLHSVTSPTTSFNHNSYPLNETSHYESDDITVKAEPESSVSPPSDFCTPARTTKPNDDMLRRVRSSSALYTSMPAPSSPTSVSEQPPSYAEATNSGSPIESPYHYQMHPFPPSTSVPLLAGFSQPPSYTYSALSSQHNHPASMRHPQLAPSSMTTTHGAEALRGINFQPDAGAMYQSRSTYPPISHIGGEYLQQGPRQPWLSRPESSSQQHSTDASRRSNNHRKSKAASMPRIKNTRSVRSAPYPVSGSCGRPNESESDTSARFCQGPTPSGKTAKSKKGANSQEEPAPAYTPTAQSGMGVTSPASGTDDSDAVSISGATIVNVSMSADMYIAPLSGVSNLPDTYSDKWNNQAVVFDNSLRKTTSMGTPAKDEQSSATNSIENGEGSAGTVAMDGNGKAKEKQPKEKQHKEEKIFQCKLCPKRFTRGFNLRSHENTHKNFRPYPCHYCEWAFTRRTDMVRHLKTKHRGSPMVITCLDARKGTGNNQWTKQKAIETVVPSKQHWPMIL